MGQIWQFCVWILVWDGKLNIENNGDGKLAHTGIIDKDMHDGILWKVVVVYLFSIVCGKKCFHQPIPHKNNSCQVSEKDNQDQD